MIQKYNYICNCVMNSNQYDFQDKEKSISDYIEYMINRCQSMIRYENLPETIPAKFLELMLQLNGNCFMFKHNGKYYITVGGLGGEPDEYYFPTLYTYTNPYLKISKNAKINEDGILIQNDTLLKGLLPLHRRYATMLAEIDISMRLAVVNSRISSLISAQDDRTLKSATKYLEQIEDGDIGIIAETQLLDGIKVQPYAVDSTGSNMLSLIELKNSILASWLNELGLDANTNLKREYVSNDELTLTSDSLLPLIDDMLRCRIRAIKKINEKWGLNIKVFLNSSWEDNQKQVDDVLYGEKHEKDEKEEEYENDIENIETIDETKTNNVIEKVENENIDNSESNNENEQRKDEEEDED